LLDFSIFPQLKIKAKTIITRRVIF